MEELEPITAVRYQLTVRCHMERMGCLDILVTTLEWQCLGDLAEVSAAVLVGVLVAVLSGVEDAGENNGKPSSNL